MIGRRSAALLCVLLAHAWVVFMLLRLQPAVPPARLQDSFVSEPITLELDVIEPEPVPRPPAPATQVPRHASPVAPSPGTPAPAGDSTAITPPAFVDWPLEGKKSAARVLAREAEAERIARLFAGPNGTWASLTKRQRSRLNKFHFRPGIDGLEYDEKGNQIFHLSDGCVVVNSAFIACALGKAKVHGDMFENMREYFDEQRLPETPEGNGTEPEALRPAN
jgi:hypothetical protein